MAYKCTMTCFNKRLFEKDVLYDSIGDALPDYFEEVETGEDAAVIETGLAPVEDLEREEVKEELKELGVSFNGRAKSETLKGLLDEARQASMLA